MKNIYLLKDINFISSYTEKVTLLKYVQMYILLNLRIHNNTDVVL